MGKNNFHVDKADHLSVEALIDAFNARGTEYETAIRKALSLHSGSFLLYIDHLNRPLDQPPLDDAFTFNITTGELVLFTEAPGALIDAILEMAMFLRGFDTRLGEGDEWEVQLAIGAWRHVRRSLRVDLEIAPEPTWRVKLDLEPLERFNMFSFGTALYLAGRPNVQVTFANGTNAMVMVAYERIARMLEAVALDIGLEDSAIFNRRLRRTIRHIAHTLLPDPDPSPFDELLGPDGFDQRFFEDDPGAVLM